MIHEDTLRQFSIDIGNLPKRSYRLMAVVYDLLTGKRIAWIDSDANPPNFYHLPRLPWNSHKLALPFAHVLP